MDLYFLRSTLVCKTVPQSDRTATGPNRDTERQSHTIRNHPCEARRPSTVLQQSALQKSWFEFKGVCRQISRREMKGGYSIEASRQGLRRLCTYSITLPFWAVRPQNRPFGYTPLQRARLLILPCFPKSPNQYKLSTTNRTCKRGVWRGWDICLYSLSDAP